MAASFVPKPKPKPLKLSRQQPILHAYQTCIPQSRHRSSSNAATLPRTDQLEHQSGKISVLRIENESTAHVKLDNNHQKDIREQQSPAMTINMVRPPSMGITIRLSSTFSPGLRPVQFFTASATINSRRSISSRALTQYNPTQRLTSSKLSLLSATPPSSNPPGSFFTPSLCRTGVRHASTTTQPDPTPATRPGISNPPAASVVLNWNDFFKLRKTRRTYSLISSIIFSMGSCAATAITLTESPDIQDQLTKLIPADPFITLGIVTMSGLLLGWLIGPVFGNGLWRLFHRSRLPEFTIKEREFFARVKAHRVNPAGASTNNPVPDFYGEKVGSVQGYRRWLKDQRAFNRKRGGII